MSLHPLPNFVFAVFFSVLIASISAEKCDGFDERFIGVAEACMGSEGLEACPDDCLPKLSAYATDCKLEIQYLSQLVVETKGGICFDDVFQFVANLRGMDCGNHRSAYRSMFTLVCMTECSEKCIDIIDGVCAYCNGLLTEMELSATAPHCPQSLCDLVDDSKAVSSESNGLDSSLMETSAVSGGARVSLIATALAIFVSLDLLDYYQ